MRKYVKIFQQAEPAIFTIHIDQVDVFTDFDFIEPVVLSELNSIRKLKTIDFSSTENHLRSNLFSIARKIVKIFKLLIKSVLPIWLKHYH